LCNHLLKQHNTIKVGIHVYICGGWQIFLLKFHLNVDCKHILLFKNTKELDTS
jgi:hypothetical protein